MLEHKDLVGPDDPEMTALPIPSNQFEFAIVIKKETSVQLLPRFGFALRHGNGVGNDAHPSLLLNLVEDHFPENHFHWGNSPVQILKLNRGAAASFNTVQAVGLCRPSVIYFLAAASVRHFLSPTSRAAADSNPFSPTATVSSFPPDQTWADM
jgi:hypothetical protein